jgi:hypothetical protein
MAERTCERVLARSLWSWLTSLMALPLMALPLLPAVASADSLPASVRACASETDALQRLECYDREVARYPAPAPKATSKHEPAAAASAPTNTSAATSSPTAATSAGAAVPPGAAVSPSAAAPSGAATPTAPAAGQSPAATSSPSSATNTSPQEPKRVSAHVVSIDHSSDATMVLHLDNGQTWEELQSVAGDLSLRQGDSVTIDKHFGSYWLTGPHVSSMRVRQKT